MNATVKTFLIVALALLLVWFGTALIRVENQRYAMFVGLCPFDAKSPEPHWKCLSTVQTRTNPLWHLYYALLP